MATLPDNITQIGNSRNGGLNILGGLYVNSVNFSGEFENVVSVCSEDDLPEAVGGVITLEGNTLYRLTPYCNVITNNRIEISASTSIQGSSGATLIYTGTGTFFTVTGGTTFSLRDVGYISCANGKFIDMQTQTSAFVWNGSTCVCSSIGTMSADVIFWNGIQIQDFTEGLTFEGTDISSVTLSSFNIKPAGSGTFNIFDMGTATSEIWSYRDAVIDFGASTQTFLAGLSNGGNITSGGSALVASVRFIGASGSPSDNNVGPADTYKWRWDGTVSGPQTIVDAHLYITSANEATTTISGTGIGNEVLVAGTWSTESATLISTTTGGRITYLPEESRSLPLVCSCRIEPVSGSNKSFELYYKVNGTTLITGSRCRVRASSGTPQNCTVVGQYAFNQNDYVELYIVAQTDTTDVIVRSPSWLTN